jgi:hypothetical protein
MGLLELRAAINNGKFPRNGIANLIAAAKSFASRLLTFLYFY